MSIRVLALAAVLAAGGCAPTHVLRDFTTDGCSLFPDGETEGPVCRAECCRQHDMAYWRGGTADERKSADQAFRECVAQAGTPTLAGLMYHAVRAGGMPLVPTWYRWGYGWGYGRGYEPLTPDEQRQAAEKLAADRVRPGPCGASRRRRRLPRAPASRWRIPQSTDSEHPG